MTRELRHVTQINNTEGYFFRFSGLGWAEVILNEASGLFLIHSDLGTFAHHWSSSCLPKNQSLKQFISKVSPEYLIEKFSYGREFRDWDPEKTKNLLTDTAEELYEGEVLTAIMKEIEDTEWRQGANIFYYSAGNKLHNIFNPLYEYLIYSFKPDIIFLRDELLPIIQKHFQEEEKEEK